MNSNNVFVALSDETRRDILALLKKKNMSAGEIAAKFDISKPSISHHLSSLKNANLVSEKRDGQHIIYSLNLSVMEEVAAAFFELFKKRGGSK
ncbi:MAG: ArsR family transcriptional regulator [Candidatus Firestonebacteria bacterium RIFOXYC2_FULL_39_67]|nr:MAG: ArsR family transcriptional regulator [Candidatus Firestonebacteria bacterium RIFOXYD2_FULL_39_29]OGF55237.1 MAG: ArsR family transcriptional regulator [Candidatus Firestonebacteria bacterium RIFOXYC2_FULL_39_67]